MTHALPWIVIGFIIYIGTAALGTSAQLGWVNTRPFRWLHHALFAMVWLSLLAALVATWLQPAFGVLIGVALCMAALPFFRAGTRPHCTTATLGLGCYAAALLWALI